MNKKNTLMILLAMFLIIGSINVFGDYFNPSVWYSYDNIIGTSMLNIVNSSTSNATIGGCTSQSGKIGNSSKCTGAGKYIRYSDIGDNFDFGSGEFTINIWAKNVGTAQPQGFFHRASSPTYDSVFLIGLNQPSLLYMTDNGASWNILNGVTLNDADAWTMYTLRRIGNNISYFVNGVFIGSTAYSGTLPAKNTDAGTCNFNSNFGSGSQSDCEVDELGVWKGYGLTNTEISTLYNGGTGLTYPFSTTTNFTITSTNNYNSQSILNFSAIINGTTYNTTTGTLTTPFLTNSTTLKNITIISQNMFNKTYLNQNISTSLSATQDQYPVLFVKNFWNQSNISSFNVTNGGFYSTSNGLVYLPLNTSTNILVQSQNHFSLNTTLSLLQNTIQSVNLTQTAINISARNVVTNTSFYNYTVSINGTNVCNATGLADSCLAYPNAGNYYVYVAPIDNVSFHAKNTTNITFNALDNYTLYVYPHEHTLNVTARNILTNVSINNFSVTISSYNRTDVRNYSTTSGSILIPAVHDAYNLLLDAAGYSLVYQNLTVVTGDYNVTFNVFTTNSLDLYFYKYSDGSNMSGVNVTVNFIGLTAQENKTSTGNLYVDLFSPDTYTILYQANGYRQGKYIIDLVNRSYNRLDLYLENETNSNLILITVKDKFGKTLPNVEVLVQKWYNDGWVTDQIVATDFQGRAEAYYVLSTVYYNHVLTYNGVTYFGAINNNANKKVIYAEDVSNGLNFNIDILGQSILPAYQKTQQIYSNLSYVNVSNSSGYFRFYWSDPDNQQRKGCLEIINASSNAVIYYSCSNTATGTIISDTINVGSTVTYFRANGYIDDFPNENRLEKIGVKAADNINWGVTGYIVALLLLVIAFFGFIYAPTISLIVGFVVFALLAIFGVIFGNLSGKDYGALFVLAVITYLIARIPSISGVNR